MSISCLSWKRPWWTADFDDSSRVHAWLKLQHMYCFTRCCVGGLSQSTERSQRVFEILNHFSGDGLAQLCFQVVHLLSKQSGYFLRASAVTLKNRTQLCSKHVHLSCTVHSEIYVHVYVQCSLYPFLLSSSLHILPFPLYPPSTYAPTLFTSPLFISPSTFTRIYPASSTLQPFNPPFLPPSLPPSLSPSLSPVL